MLTLHSPSWSFLHQFKIIADIKIGRVWMSISCITHLCQKKRELEGKTDSKKDVEEKTKICNCDLVISKVWSSILILLDCFCLAVCALFAYFYFWEDLKHFWVKLRCINNTLHTDFHIGIISAEQNIC